jgi:hypothetical protein
MYVRVALVLLVGGSVTSGAAAQASCEIAPVTVARWWGQFSVEEARLTLIDCGYEPNLAALEELSVLARPQGVDRPEAPVANPMPGFVAPGIARLDPQLPVRLQAIADRFPGRRIEIISGYRPRARRTSRHRLARALDVRVDGVSRAHLSDFLRTLPETGVGYYPNSAFTHVDVRERRYYWVDNSGPGERPAYDREPTDDVDRERREILAKALEELGRIAEIEDGSGSVGDVDVDRE